MLPINPDNAHLSHFFHKFDCIGETSCVHRNACFLQSLTYMYMWLSGTDLICILMYANNIVVTIYMMNITVQKLFGATSVRIMKSWHPHLVGTKRNINSPVVPIRNAILVYNIPGHINRSCTRYQKCITETTISCTYIFAVRHNGPVAAVTECHMENRPLLCEVDLLPCEHGITSLLHLTSLQLQPHTRKRSCMKMTASLPDAQKHRHGQLKYISTENTQLDILEVNNYSAYNFQCGQLLHSFEILPFTIKFFWI